MPISTLVTKCLRTATITSSLPLLISFSSSFADTRLPVLTPESCDDACILEILNEAPGEYLMKSDLPPDMQKTCSPFSLVVFNGVTTPLIRGILAEALYWSLDSTRGVIRGLGPTSVYANGALCYSFGARRVIREGATTHATIPYACFTAIPEEALPLVLGSSTDALTRGGLLGAYCTNAK